MERWGIKINLGSQSLLSGGKKWGFRLAGARRKSVYKISYKINNSMLLFRLKQLLGRLGLVIFMWNALVVLLVFQTIL